MVFAYTLISAVNNMKKWSQACVKDANSHNLAINLVTVIIFRQISSCFVNFCHMKCYIRFICLYSLLYKIFPAITYLISLSPCQLIIYILVPVSFFMWIIKFLTFQLRVLAMLSSRFPSVESFVENVYIYIRNRVALRTSSLNSVVKRKQ